MSVHFGVKKNAIFDCLIANLGLSRSLCVLPFLSLFFLYVWGQECCQGREREKMARPFFFIIFYLSIILSIFIQLNNAQTSTCGATYSARVEVIQPCGAGTGTITLYFTAPADTSSRMIVRLLINFIFNFYYYYYYMYHN